MSNMETITIKITDRDARVIAGFLRAAYGKNKNTSLNTLCEIAIRTEVAKQAQKELDEAEKELNQ